MKQAKKILAICEKGPNYIFHALALARAGFDSSYADRYSGSMAPADRRNLAGLKKLVSFGNGGGGELIFPLVFFPAYLNLDSQAKLGSYLSFLKACAASGNCGAIVKTYAEPLGRLAHWGRRGDPALPFQGLRKYTNEIRKIAGVYERGFASYEREVWPRELPALERTASAINNYFLRRDIIGEWEALAARRFKFPVYQIVLCGAIENGPNANSLGYERNVFFSGGDLRRTLQLISHETGTHLLIGEVVKLYEAERFAPAAVYAAYECLCKFYNGLVLGRKPSYGLPMFNEAAYLPVYKKLYRAGPRPLPGRMLAKALTEVAAEK